MNQIIKLTTAAAINQKTDTDISMNI